MKINQIKNELDELWAAVESKRHDRGPKWLGYWWDRWSEAHGKGDGAIKDLLTEVEDLLRERGDDGVLKLINALLLSEEEYNDNSKRN